MTKECSETIDFIMTKCDYVNGILDCNIEFDPLFNQWCAVCKDETLILRSQDLALEVVKELKDFNESQ